MRKALLALLVVFFSFCLQADELIVIANQKNAIKSLNADQVQDIYMGRKRTFPDGKMALPIDHAILRPDFYQKLTTRPIEQINAYWARIMFSGQASPPLILQDDKSVLEAIAENAGAIGYVNKSSLTKDVHILLILK